MITAALDVPLVLGIHKFLGPRYVFAISRFIARLLYSFQPRRAAMYTIADYKVREYNCVVARSHGQIAGYVISRTIQCRKIGDTPERRILNIHVNPDYRRRGIGVALLEREVQRRANIVAEVRESNVPSLELFLKCGFSEVGQVSNFYKSPTETAVIMRRKLEATPKTTRN